MFAHNGKLAGIHADPRFATTRFRPVGDTDSEAAFCYLLERLSAEVPRAPGHVSGGHLEAWLREAVETLSTLGEFNFPRRAPPANGSIRRRTRARPDATLLSQAAGAPSNSASTTSRR